MQSIKISVLLIIISCLEPSLLYAIVTQPVGEEFSEYVNEEMINGEVWKTFTDREKTIFMYGFEDGVMNTVIHFVSDKDKADQAISSIPSSIKDTPMEDIIKKIDEFYSDEKNIGIQVYYVVLIIRNRKLEVEETKINKYIEYLRNGYKSNENLEKLITGETKDETQTLNKLAD